MCVCKTDSPGEERMRFDQNTNLAHTSDLDSNQRIQFGKSVTAISQRTEGDFGGDKRMHHYTAALEQHFQIWIHVSKMVDPNRCVCQNHC